MLFAAMLLVGCSGGTSKPGTAPVTLNVVMASARVASNESNTSLWASLWRWLPSVTAASAQAVTDIATIQVEVSAADMALQTVTVPVSNPTSGQTVTVELNVNAGLSRTIYVSAYNAAGTKLFSGTASGVNLTAGVPVAVPITLAPTMTVTVRKTGTGGGTVASSPAGIDCGTTCATQFEGGTSVTLTATATTGSFFVGWSGGGCTGTGPCSVSGTVTVTARFDLVAGVGITFPPEVVARNPDSGATNVPTNATVTAIFNTDMDTGTITTSTFTMTDQFGFTVQGSASYDAGTKTATFNPGGLGASTAYTVRLTSGMKDQTGVALASDVVWPFTTSTTLLPLVSGLNQLQGLGVDDSFVYFTERGPTPGTGTVKKVPKNGGTVITLASNLDFPSAFASDSASIYAVENGPSARTVKKVSKADGTVTTLVSTGLVNPVGGTVDANFVYFVDLGSTSGTGRIGKVPVGGGSETNVATGLNFPFGGPVVDNAFLYFSEVGVGSGKIRKVPLGGGPVTDLATGLFAPQPTVSVDSTFVYFGEAGFSIGSGMIKKVPLDPGGSVFALASGQRFNVSFPIAMRLDNSYVYFVENMPVTSGGGTVKKVSVNGDTVVTLASGLDVPNRLAFDSTHVYFSEFAAGVSGAGTIKKVPK